MIAKKLRLIGLIIALALLALRAAPAEAFTCAYPGSLVTFLQMGAEDGTWKIRNDVEDAGAKTVAYNKLADCLQKVITELGIAPRGGYADVVTRLNDAVSFGATRAANLVLAGPTSGAAAAPSFRSLVAGDIPSLAASIINSGVFGVANGGSGADLSATGGTGKAVFQEALGAALTVRVLATADLPSTVIDSLTKVSNALCVDGEIPKKVSGAWACSADATGGSPNLNTILNPVAAVSFTIGANNYTVTFDSASGVMAWKFTSNFASGPQWLVQQVTGNPTGGILAEFRAADADVIALQAGDGTNGIKVTQPGVLQVVGTGQIVANRTICDNTNPILRYDGACTTVSGATWSSLGNPTGALNLTMGANSSLFTFDNSSGKIEFDFTSAFSTGSQFLIKQLTGNPTGGTLFEVQAADTDVTVAKLGDGTNYINVSKTGALTAVGSGSVTATILALASNPANCSAGSAPLGIDTAGAAEGCFAVMTSSSTETKTNLTLDAEGTGNVISVPVKVWLPAAGCNNATAGPIWDLPTSTAAAAACVTGTNIQKGVLDYADTAGGFSAQITQALPADWTTTGGLDAVIYWTTTATTGNAKWSLSTACTDVAASATDDPAFNTANTVTTAAPGTANRVQTSAIAGLTTTGCTTATKMLLHLKLFRDGNDAADTIAATARVIGVELTYRRAM